MGKNKLAKWAELKTFNNVIQPGNSAQFEKDHPLAEYLKLKSFTVSHPIADEALLEKESTKKFAKIFQSIQPLNDFLQLPFS